MNPCQIAEDIAAQRKAAGASPRLQAFEAISEEIKLKAIIDDLADLLEPFEKYGWFIARRGKDWLDFHKSPKLIALTIAPCTTSRSVDGQLVLRSGYTITWELERGCPENSDLSGTVWADDHLRDPSHPDGFIVRFGTWMADYL